MRLSGGPIIEQCTHFVDIARYLGGEVEMSTLTAISIPPPLAQTSDTYFSLGCLEDTPNDAVTGKNVEEVPLYS